MWLVFADPVTYIVQKYIEEGSIRTTRWAHSHSLNYPGCIHAVCSIEAVHTNEDTVTAILNSDTMSKGCMVFRNPRTLGSGNQAHQGC